MGALYTSLKHTHRFQVEYTLSNSEKTTTQLAANAPVGECWLPLERLDFRSPWAHANYSNCAGYCFCFDLVFVNLDTVLWDC